MQWLHHSTTHKVCELVTPHRKMLHRIVEGADRVGGALHNGEIRYEDDRGCWNLM